MAAKNRLFYEFSFSLICLNCSMEKDWLPGEDFSRSNEKGMERNDTQLQKAETTNYKDGKFQFLSYN